jgi:hypothetical protein
MDRVTWDDEGESNRTSEADNAQPVSELRERHWGKIYEVTIVEAYHLSIPTKFRRNCDTSVVRTLNPVDQGKRSPY